MDTPEPDVERRPGRDEWTRLALRLVGIGAFGFVLVRSGLLADPPWVIMLTALGWVLMLALAVVRVVGRFDAWAVAAIAVLMVCGALVNPEIQFLGSVFFVVGGMILVSQPDVSPRIAAVVLAGSALLTLAIAGWAERSWAVVLSISAGTVAIALFGALRRQSRTRQAQDRALAARSRDLELRNAELLAQTEATRREAARAAALEERSRIARDLHDLLAHSLGGLVVQLEAAGAELAQGDQTAAANRLAASRQLAVDGLREARAAVTELRREPDGANSGPVDLVDSVRTVLHGPVGLSLGVVIDVVGTPRPGPAAVGSLLAAVAREALTNVNKHAGGVPVSATLIFDRDRIRLEVVNGLTESPSELARTGAGAGLRGIAERVEALGGTVAAGPEGRRWVVTVSCPMR